jgi:hypothetical protein
MYLFIQFKDKFLEEMKNIEFCPLGYSINELIIFSEKIMFSNIYCQKNFNPNTINKLLSHISKEYGIVSYHNFTHAFSVQLVLFYFLLILDVFSMSLHD